MRRFKSVPIIVLMGISLMVLAAGEAFAISLSGGGAVTKGVQCFADGNGQGATLTGTCHVNSGTSFLIICRNPDGKLNTGESSRQIIEFVDGAVTPTTIDKKGRITFSVVTNAAGVHPEDDFSGAQCQDEPACAALQTECPNHNWWPADVVPLEMNMTLALWYCDADNIHNCPCDPLEDASDPNNPESGPVDRCATAVPNKQGNTSSNTWSYIITDTNNTGTIDHNDLIPAAEGTFVCTVDIGDPKDWVFGQQLPYSCVQQS